MMGAPPPEERDHTRDRYSRADKSPDQEPPPKGGGLLHDHLRKALVPGDGCELTTEAIPERPRRGDRGQDPGQLAG
jgi:hypothetical protein